MIELYPFPHWVDKEIIDGYANKGVKGLFKWQKQLLEDACNSTSNVVYSAPTSAGKSLVAELLALRAAIEGKQSLFVLPYISVAREKFNHLQKLWRRIDLVVAGYMGHSSTQARDWSCAVCTMEKANSLVNRLISEESISNIGIVIVDELHMVSDTSRGGNLESLCSKLTFCQREHTEMRIVGMSATLTRKDHIERWLNTPVFESDFRPVTLKETVSIEGSIHSLDSLDLLRKLDRINEFPGDPDKSVGITIESMSSGALTLVFCSSKADVEKTATEVAKRVMSLLQTRPDLQEQVDRQALLGLKVELERLGPIDPLLRNTLPRAIGFHHAGLTSEERECLEESFRKGVVRVLVATSTLSSGVNLPANRVLIRAQIRGPAAINQTTYKQMAGRAGRMGHAESGESILICRKGEWDTVRRLISEPPDRGNDVFRDPVKTVLETVCSGLCKSLDDVKLLIDSLLYPTIRDAEKTIEDLESLKLISREIDDNETVQIRPTQLGTAALASSLPPDAALFVFEDLRRASKAICIESELHMLYLVTPVNLSVWTGTNWNNLHSIYTNLTDDQKRIARLIGVQEAVIICLIQSRPVDPKKHQLHLRFFSALALYDIINEVSLQDVSSKFRVNRGSLQQLQLQSATYASMVVAFSSRLGWVYLRSLLEGFASRLAFGVRRELTELVRLQGVDGSRARALHSAGITSLSELANAEPRTVANVLTTVVPFESSAENDGLGEWLFGEGRSKLCEAVADLIARADAAVTEQIRDLGIISESQFQSIKKKREKKLTQKLDEDREIIREEVSIATQRHLSQIEDARLNDDEENGLNNDYDIICQEKIINSEDESNSIRTSHIQCESIRDSADSGYDSRNSTPLNEESLSKSCYTANTSVDLFSQSIVESVADLSLDDSEPKSENAESTSNSARQKEILGEIEDLECSLIGEAYLQNPNNIQNNVVEDSFNVEPSFFVRQKNSAQNKHQAEDSFNGNKDNVMDSFDESITYMHTSKSILQSSSKILNSVEEEDSFDVDPSFFVKQKASVENKNRLDDSFNDSKENVVDSFDESITFINVPKSKRQSISKDNNNILRRSLLMKKTLPRSPLAEQQSIRRRSENEMHPSPLATTSQSCDKELLEDSFDASVHFATPKREPTIHLTSSRTISYIEEADMSADMFGSSMSSVDSPGPSNYVPIFEPPVEVSQRRYNLRSTPQHTPTSVVQRNKRSRTNVGYPHSPSTSSPHTKSFRRLNDSVTENEPVIFNSKTESLKAGEEVEEIQIDDVCRSESTWLQFQSLSASWSECGLGLTTKRADGKEILTGLSLYVPGQHVVWIPLSDDQFYGNAEQENLCPSNTPSDTISMDDRVDVVANILRSCTHVFVYDAMRTCDILRHSHPDIQIQNPVDVCYLSFLALIRNGDSSLPLPDLIQRCKFAAPINRYLHATPRIRASVTAFVLPILFWQIRPTAVKHSSEKSVQLELDSMGVACRMMTRGVVFDKKECDVRLSQLRKRLEEISDECAVLAGKPVDLNSSKDVANLLFTRLKLPYPGNSHTRNRSTSKETLQQLVDKHPIPAKIIEYRRIQFSISHHIRSLKVCISPLTDTVHPILDLFTSTGRLISTHPNVQNVTKEELIKGFGVRSLFVARRGYVFVAADYSQLELRVMAHLSGDEKLCGLFAEKGRDIFTEMANEMKKNRAAVKQLCYGIIYGIGSRALSELLKCTQKEAQELISTFFKTYPKVKTYNADVKDKSVADKFVTTVLGRKRLTSTDFGKQLEKAKDERQTINFTIQGTASEIFKTALVQLEKELQAIDGYLVLPIHDEVICEVPEKFAGRAHEIIRNTMESSFEGFHVPLPVKTSQGKNWAELQK